MFKPQKIKSRNLNRITLIKNANTIFNQFIIKMSTYLKTITIENGLDSDFKLEIIERTRNVIADPYTQDFSYAAAWMEFEISNIIYYEYFTIINYTSSFPNTKQSDLYYKIMDFIEKNIPTCFQFHKSPFYDGNVFCLKIR